MILALRTWNQNSKCTRPALGKHSKDDLRTKWEEDAADREANNITKSSRSCSWELISSFRIQQLRPKKKAPRKNRQANWEEEAEDSW
jgi:hypothetical protein